MRRRARAALAALLAAAALALAAGQQAVPASSAPQEDASTAVAQHSRRYDWGGGWDGQGSGSGSTDCLPLGSGCVECSSGGGRRLQASSSEAPAGNAAEADGSAARSLQQAAAEAAAANATEGAVAAASWTKRRRSRSRRSGNRNDNNNWNGGWSGGSSSGYYGGGGGGSSDSGPVTCTACDSSRNYRLVRQPDGTQRCGCRNGYGVFVRGTSQSTTDAWQQQYVNTFACTPCPSGQVSLLPTSNLVPAWNGYDWELQLQDSGASTAAPADAAASTTATAAATAAAARAFYQRGCGNYHRRGHHVPPPWWPGQCVPCPYGSWQNGYRCHHHHPRPPPPPCNSPSPPHSPSPPDDSPSPPPPTTSPSPRPPPLVSPSPAPPSSYCCGTSSCATAVPEPPIALPASHALRAKAVTARKRIYRPAKASVLLPRNRVPKSQQATTLEGLVRPSTVCAANPRVSIGNPPWTGVSAAVVTLTIFFADLTPGTQCEYTASNPGGFACTGQQLAPHLILTAAHCVDPAIAVQPVPGCAAAELVFITVCYNYNPENAAGTVTWQCSSAADQVIAIGASWQRNRGGATADDVTAPYDQGIVFTSEARPGPYFKYNYIENINVNSAATWQSLSFTGRGYNATGDSDNWRCGCKVCPGMTCNLARTGPWTGAPTTDADVATANGALNPNLEACGGSSGNCLSVNGDSCCIGTDSYERVVIGDPPCNSQCSNFWSSISAAKPLSAVWSSVQVDLPKIG